MADRSHIQIVRRGAASIAEWRTTAPDYATLDLSELDLDDADLRNADLAGANLRRSSLRSADLRCADLAGADLDDVDLTGARLAGAFLGAISYRAGQWPHSFAGRPATFRGTRFNASYFGRTVICDADISTAVGLEEVLHQAPSHITNGTLRHARGSLPVTFLRGCGLAEWEIEQARLYGVGLSSADVVDIVYRVFDAHVARAIQYYSCFISYSHADRDFARLLHDRLQQEGIRCWLDEHQLLPGDDIFNEVDRAIAGWDKLLLCCSGASLTSWWVDNEVTAAFAKEQQLFRSRGRKTNCVIPLDLDGHIFSPYFERGYRDQLRSRFVGRFQGWETLGAEFTTELSRLVKALRTDRHLRQLAPPSLL